MGLNKATAASRLTAIPANIEAAMTAAPSDGKRMLFESMGDKYGTWRVRAYVPESIGPDALQGLILDYNAKGVLAEDPDDNTNRKQLVARSVIGAGGKFLPLGADHYEDTILIVVNVPNWADVDTVTLTV
jgi:hypothetical protein